MPLPRIRHDPTVVKLRWVMLAVILADMGLTLAGQPTAFWSEPGSAIRGDGLGIHNLTNHSFEFFLAAGWPAYLACFTVYAASCLLMASVLPRGAALVLLCTVTLSHLFTGTNWLAIRWHAGMLASPIYGLGIGLPLTLVVARGARPGSESGRHLAWIAAATLLVDGLVTLLGQPGSYWSDPGTAYEGNAVSRYFLVHGWWAFAAYDLIYAFGLYLGIRALPWFVGMVVGFYFLVVSFNGASNWLFFVWRLGLPAVLAYGVLVSAALAIFVFALEPRPAAVLGSVPPG